MTPTDKTTDHDLPVKKFDVRNCSHVWIGTGDRVYCVGDCGVSILAIANPTYGFCNPPPSTVEAVTKAMGYDTPPNTTKWEKIEDDKWVCWLCDKKYDDLLSRNTHIEEEHPTDTWVMSWVQRGRPLE